MPENENHCDTCTSSLGRPCPDARRLECYAPDWAHYERRLSIDTAPGACLARSRFARVVAPRNDESDCPAPLAPPRGSGAPERICATCVHDLEPSGEGSICDDCLASGIRWPDKTSVAYAPRWEAKQHDESEEQDAAERETAERECLKCPLIADLQRELGESEAALDEATDGASRAVQKIAELTVRLSDLGSLHSATLERLHDLERRCPPTSADTLAQIRDLVVLAMEESEEKTRRHAEACLDLMQKRDEMERRLTRALETTEMQRRQLAAVADLARQAQRDGGIGEVGR